LPLFKYAPMENLALIGKTSNPERPHNPSDLITGILPKPSLTTNRKDFLSTITDRSLKASVSKLFGLSGILNNQQKLILETKEVRRYTLNNPAEYFKVLMGDELYNRDVRALLNETRFGEAYLVVGFLTTSKARWSQDNFHESTFQAEATIPVTEISGLPPVPGLNIDPTFSAQIMTTQASKTTHLSLDEEIFAVAYAPVKAPKFRRKGEVVIGRAKPAGAAHLAFGESDSDGSDSDEVSDADGEDGEALDIKLDENGRNFADQLADDIFEF